MYRRGGALGNAEQDALNAIRERLSAFLSLANAIQTWRAKLTTAETRGISRDEVYGARQQVNAFEQDYKAVRGKLLLSGTPTILLKVKSGSNAGALASVMGLLRKRDTLDAQVARVASGKIPTPPPAADDEDDGTSGFNVFDPLGFFRTTKKGGVGEVLTDISGDVSSSIKWLAIGVIAYVALDVSHTVRRSR